MDAAIFVICTNSFEVAAKFATLNRNINGNRELIGYYTGLYRISSTSSTFLELVEVILNNLFLKDIPTEVQVLLYLRKWRLWEALEQAAIVDDLEFVKHFRDQYDISSLFVINILSFLYHCEPENKTRDYLFAEGGCYEEDDNEDYSIVKTLLRYGFVEKAREYFATIKDTELIASCIEEFAQKGIREHSEEIYLRSELIGILKSGKLEYLVGNPKYQIEKIPEILDSFALCIGSAEMVDYLIDIIDVETIEQNIAESEPICSYKAMKRIVEIKGNIDPEDGLFASECSIIDDLKLCKLFGIPPNEILVQYLRDIINCLDALKILVEKKLLTPFHIKIAKALANDFPDLELRAFLNDPNLKPFKDDSSCESDSD